jgi:hypothetical protein
VDFLRLYWLRCNTPQPQAVIVMMDLRSLPCSRHHGNRKAVKAAGFILAYTAAQYATILQQTMYTQAACDRQVVRIRPTLQHGLCKLQQRTYMHTVTPAQQHIYLHM